VFDSLEEYQKHLKSDLYRFNLKRKALGLAPITQEKWEEVQKEKKDKEKEGEVKSTGHIKKTNKEKMKKRK